MIAQICLEKTAFSYDSEYSYRVPKEMEASLAPGCRVTAPFGKGNRMRQGLVLSLEEGAGEGLKSLASQIDPAPLLTPEMLGMLRYLRETTLCTYCDALGVLIPAGIGVTLRQEVSLNRQADLKGLEGKEREAALLLSGEEWMDGAALARQLGGESELVESMIHRGLLISREYAKKKVGDKTMAMARLSAAFEEDGGSFGALTPKQRAVVQLLEQSGCAAVKEIEYYCSAGPAVVKRLADKGVVELFDRVVYRNPYDRQEEEEIREFPLTPDQERAFQAIWDECRRERYGVSLLYGVTGSGKTQVFLRLIRETAAAGKTSILLVPEISLTPQSIRLFRQSLGNRVGVLHSGLSLGERADEYRRIRSGEVQLVIGTRSAIFAPVERLGLVILDEEQEHTYKSDRAPRFHAREAAKFRCRWHGARLVLASATPSVESYYLATQGKYQMVRLPERFPGASLPDVYLVDMRDQAPGAVFSAPLLTAMEENLERGEQTILLLNRRGYHTVVKCASCGEPASCPNCSVPLTYHQANGRLMCHYCGYSRPASGTCPLCGGSYTRYQGTGTQRVQEMLEEYFPDAGVLRVDMDTTLSKFSHEKHFHEFLSGKYDIMIGTQMVAKGHNFPGVTLVGVLNADSSLYGEDFRSSERTFSLITQVVGRSGRGAKAGRAVIQTYTPESTVILQASAQDYGAFFESEIALRRISLYPPFCSLCMVGFVGEDGGRVEEAARWFTREFSGRAAREFPRMPLRLLGPCEPPVFRAAGKYRYRLLIKCRLDRPFLGFLREQLCRFSSRKEFRDVTAYADPYYDHSM